MGGLYAQNLRRSAMEDAVRRYATEMGSVRKLLMDLTLPIISGVCDVVGWWPGGCVGSQHDVRGDIWILAGSNAVEKPGAGGVAQPRAESSSNSPSSLPSQCLMARGSTGS